MTAMLPTTSRLPDFPAGKSIAPGTLQASIGAGLRTSRANRSRTAWEGSPAQYLQGIPGFPGIVSSREGEALGMLPLIAIDLVTLPGIQGLHGLMLKEGCVAQHFHGSFLASNPCGGAQRADAPPTARKMRLPVTTLVTTPTEKTSASYDLASARERASIPLPH